MPQSGTHKLLFKLSIIIRYGDNNCKTDKAMMLSHNQKSPDYQSDLISLVTYIHTEILKGNTGSIWIIQISLI